jgi:N-formylglutamate amidohydrolase
MEEAFAIEHAPGQMVWAAVHAGHDLRAALVAAVALDPSTRLREEDPFTDRMLGVGGLRVVVRRSRFEVDVNRPREQAVYRGPDEAFGLDVWKRELPPEQLEESRRIHDAFYACLAGHLDRLAARGPFLVLDVHSYNHRRGGPNAHPEPVAGNPEVNVGTGALDGRAREHALATFVETLGDQQVRDHRLDVRINVRFRGGYLCHWVVEHYPETACPLAIELKKVFMDEWTGHRDDDHVSELRDALAVAARRTVGELSDVG